MPQFTIASIVRLFLATAVFALALSACGGGGDASVPLAAPAPPAPTITPSPSVTLSANPGSVAPGASTTLTWSSTNASSCTASGAWSGSKSISGSEVVNNLLVTSAFTLNCSGAGGSQVANVSVTVVSPAPPIPTVTLRANPANVLPGGRTTLTWSSDNATACVALDGWSGTRPLAGSEDIAFLNATTTFTLQCNGASGTASAAVIVNVPTNAVPIANAGADRSVLGGATVSLSGLGSIDPDGTIDQYRWTQTAGAATNLTTLASEASFQVPLVAVDTVLTFRLVVTDNRGGVSSPDTVDVVVHPLAGGSVAIGGQITYARVPVTAFNGLDYDHTLQEPARGITVEAVNTLDGSVLSASTTDVGGFYSLAVPENVSLQMRARAELVRAGALPNWRVEVKDVEVGNTQYNVVSAPFVANVASTQNIAIQSGWNNTTRRLDGARLAAPFAILDTIYRVLQTATALSPGANLPPLVVDWSPDNPSGQTFFGGTGGLPRITLSGEADVDTEEYDPHVIAHEFGHYLDWALSRSDSIGGPHAFGDRLDPRVAWSEALATWIASVALSDSMYIDTFGNQQQQSGRFDIETNNNLNIGWYSEASLWTLLWDLYDISSDDPLALGAGPIWQAITQSLRSTEAQVAVFPFLSALRQANSNYAAQIDQLASLQGMVADTADKFGSTETNSAGSPDVLPVYTSIVVGAAPQVVRSIATFGKTNKLSNARFLRLEVSGPRTVRITATAAPGHDPDVIVHRRGVIVGSGEASGNENFSVLLNEAGSYVLEVYDCDNASCGSGAPSPADTDITMSVQAN